MSEWYVAYSNSLVSNGNLREKYNRDRIAQNMTKSMKSLKIEEMKKHGDEAYEVARATEDYLINGYNDKRLKSKALIKSAKKAIAKREKEASEGVSKGVETAKTEE